MHPFTKAFLLPITLAAFWWPHRDVPEPPADQRPTYPQLLEEEQQRRREGEARAEFQAQSRERWQQAAAGLGVISIVVLLVGISLGSSARHASPTR